MSVLGTDVTDTSSFGTIIGTLDVPAATCDTRLVID